MKRFSGGFLLFLILCIFTLSAGDKTLLNPRFTAPSPREWSSTGYFFPFPLDLENTLLSFTYKSHASCRLTLFDGLGDHVYILPPLDGESPLSRIYPLEEYVSYPVTSAVLEDWEGNPVPFSLVLADRTKFTPSAPPATHDQILSFTSEERDDYRLYRWVEGNNILIFDFRDYERQDLYLKRLAFFMEKPGFRGILMTNAEMEGLHGWNAHDYSREGLADFFNLARESGFPLNREEVQLRQIVLNEGILIDTGRKYETGEGAIISITGETSPVLRQRFITHESLHGLFFTDGAFREDIRQYWKTMPAQYREIWRFFMVNNAYDPRDEVLMYNEMLGYVLQLYRSEVADYFVWRFNRIGEIHPDKIGYVRNITPYLPETMLAIYDDLSRLVSRRYSYRNGSFHEEEQSGS